METTQRPRPITGPEDSRTPQQGTAKQSAPRHFSSLEVEPVQRTVRERVFLMCEPRYFEVEYAINPWMDTDVEVDTAMAVQQWQGLVDAYRQAGHTVELLEPHPDYPDMVFAANGATVVNGNVYVAKFAHPERQGEAELHLDWHERNANKYRWFDIHLPVYTNEAEGDFAVMGSRILAGYGFRTSREAHEELASVTGREVMSLELINPSYYHLDVALVVLDDEAEHIAYHPEAFSAESRALLAEKFPDAILVNSDQAQVFALNSLSDGYHVFVPSEATGFAEQVRTAGYQPVPIELAELRKGGGSIKCCTQELRPISKSRSSGAIV